MTFHWILFFTIVLVANLLMIATELLAIPDSPSHTADVSEHTDVRGPERIERFGAIFFFQAFLVLAIIALIVYFVYFSQSSSTSYMALWIIGLLAIAFPLFQVWSMGGIGKEAHPNSFASKVINYLTIPVTLLIAAIGTMVFVFDSLALTAFLYPLLLIALGIIIFGVMSAINRERKPLKGEQPLREIHHGGGIRRTR
ncbi:MAG TPA: hypothetical protein VMS29_03290 [Pyrinomonadaceae bacterium]|jgi:hypothetical protein|nr:hypothetical protein [Pyrinomonadaceae bacterium]